jgi:hypothetical protein
MKLLRAYISKHEVAICLFQRYRSDDFLKFYRFELNGQIKFGKREICSKAAADNEEAFKAD